MKESIKGILFKAAFCIAGGTVLLGMFVKSFYLSRLYIVLLVVALLCLIGFFVFPTEKK